MILPQELLDKILEYTKNNDLFCIEDCAHSFESYFDGSRLGFDDGRIEG